MILGRNDGIYIYHIFKITGTLEILAGCCVFIVEYSTGCVC